MALAPTQSQPLACFGVALTSQTGTHTLFLSAAKWPSSHARSIVGKGYIPKAEELRHLRPAGSPWQVQS